MRIGIRGVVVAAAAVMAAASGTAAAQSIPAPAVELHRYQPSPFSDRFLRLDGSDVMPAWRLRVGVDADYAWRPLLVDTPVGGQATGAVVRHAAGASLAVALGIGGRFEVALQLPATVYQTGDAISGVAAPDRSGVEAVRLGAKAHLVGDGLSGFGLGVAALVDVPAGGGGGLVRERGVGGEGRLFGDFRKGRLTAGLGAGYRVRPAVQLYDVALDDELIGAAAASVRVGAGTHLLAEVAGATAAKDPFRSGKQSPFEALFAVTQRIGGWTVLGGAGPGLVDGYGAPTLRVVAGVAWTNAPPRQPPPPPIIARSPLPPVVLAPKPKPAPPPPDPNLDSDGDGIPDVKDKCPNDAEDKDGFEDDDGCPDPDNDKDGIPDAADKCPNDPETFNGVDDQDGCPDTGGLVRLKDNELETLSPIFFDTDRARVHHVFYPTLDAIAAVLKARPDVGRCAIEGHTDATGPPDWNQVLSMKRAEAVVRYLTEQGVDPARLVPIGHGDALPWAPNDTPAGRAANRRVIFHIEGVDPEQAAHGIELQKQRALKRGEKPE